MNSPSSTLPAPSIAAARDGGLGYHDLENRDDYTLVDVGPLIYALGGETIYVLWDGEKVADHNVSAEDLAKGVFPVGVRNADIADAGDGKRELTYRLVYEGSGEDVSDPTSILVKRRVPGDLDPHPETPHNENLGAAFVDPDPVPPDATLVTIDVPLWINPAVGDILRLSWNGRKFEAPPLQEPFPRRVSITLTAAQILEPTAASTIPVEWGVKDEANNWSGWSEATLVDVRLEDPGLYLAPHVGDKDAPWVKVDLSALGSADLKVFTPDYDSAAPGDIVVVHALGTASDGETFEYTSPEQTMGTPGFGLTFVIPNAVVKQLDGGNLKVWYTVKRGADEALPSHSVWLPVVAAGQSDKPAPAIAEATDSDGVGGVDTLDPDDAVPAAHVTIDYPEMALRDGVTLILDGTASDGTGIHYECPEETISELAPLKVLLAQSHILRFLDGEMDVYYRVTPAPPRRYSFARRARASASVHISLQVRRGSTQPLLPAPAVDELVDGVLDGTLDSATVTIPVLAELQENDTVTLRWMLEWGKIIVVTHVVSATEAGNKALTIPVQKRSIYLSQGWKVALDYDVRRAADGTTQLSSRLVFRVHGSTTWTEDFEAIPDTSLSGVVPFWQGNYYIRSTGAAEALIGPLSSSVGRGVTGQKRIHCGVHPLRACGKLSLFCNDSNPDHVGIAAFRSGKTQDYRASSAVSTTIAFEAESPDDTLLFVTHGPGSIASQLPSWYDELALTWSEENAPSTPSGPVEVTFEEMAEGVADDVEPLLLGTSGARTITSANPHGPYVTGKYLESTGSADFTVSFYQACRSIRLGYFVGSTGANCTIYTTNSVEGIEVDISEMGWLEFTSTRDNGLIHSVVFANVQGKVIQLDNITLRFDSIWTISDPHK